MSGKNSSEAWAAIQSQIEVESCLEAVVIENLRAGCAVVFLPDERYGLLYHR